MSKSCFRLRDKIRVGSFTALGRWGEPPLCTRHWPLTAGQTWFWLSKFKISCVPEVYILVHLERSRHCQNRSRFPCCLGVWASALGFRSHRDLRSEMQPLQVLQHSPDLLLMSLVGLAELEIVGAMSNNQSSLHWHCLSVEETRYVRVTGRLLGLSMHVFYISHTTNEWLITEVISFTLCCGYSHMTPCTHCNCFKLLKQINKVRLELLGSIISRMISSSPMWRSSEYSLILQ